VVKDNVLLLAEILEYRNEKGQAVDTFSSDLKAIQRVIKLLLGEEAEMAKKISILQFDIKQLTNLREGTNKISTENEIRGFVPYENLLDVVDELEKKWMDAMEGLNQDDGSRHPANVFDAHLDLLTLALYVWDFPSRKEKFELRRNTLLFILNYNSPLVNQSWILTTTD
jgi:DNA repair ATPase RecN